MIKKIVLIFVCALVFGDGYSQNPLVKQWDKRFGGKNTENLFSILPTIDGGYILGGQSGSNISGDKTQPRWGIYDYWIIKIDSAGVKQWDKDFGGTQFDLLYSLKQTDDGGYIAGGWSQSDSSGDKTQPSWGATDFWVVKIDSLGGKIWDKDYGGTLSDQLTSLQQTSDGGYILGGYSNSGVSGNKTLPSFGGYDYWIVKIDSSGSKEWEKNFGGTNEDYLYSLQQTIDGGFILGGISWSGISGNKTHINFGNDDYWIIKTDSLGNKLWDLDFGGTSNDELYSLQQTSDKGYILGGWSFSGIGGNKSQNSWGVNDYWIVKIDSLGNKQWDKDFGGTDAESEFGNISQTMDKGYLIAGSSFSNISGDKTENNLAPKQTWVVKTDSLGNKQWDKTLHENSIPSGQKGYGIQTKDACFLMGNYTGAGIGGDKTQPNWDTICSPYCTFDYWIIKFCDTTLTTSINNLQSSPDQIGINLQLFPNPASGSIQLTFNTKHNAPVHCEIINVMEEEVFSKQLETVRMDSFGGNRKLETEIDVSFLAKGIYVVRVGDGVKWDNRKLVIE